MMFTETDAGYFFVRASKQVADAFETARVTCPAARAGDATREEFTAVAVGHATSVLKFRDKGDAVGVRQSIVGVYVVGGNSGIGSRREGRSV